MGADRQSKVELMLEQSQKELRWIQKQLSLIANGSNGPVRTNEKVKVTVDTQPRLIYTECMKYTFIHFFKSHVMSGKRGP